MCIHWAVWGLPRASLGLVATSRISDQLVLSFSASSIALKASLVLYLCRTRSTSQRTSTWSRPQRPSCAWRPTSQKRSGARRAPASLQQIQMDQTLRKHARMQQRLVGFCALRMYPSQFLLGVITLPACFHSKSCPQLSSGISFYYVSMLCH